VATITFKGNPVKTLGSLPAVGTAAPDFSLTKQDLTDVTLASFAGKKKILNVFPSLDTPVCQTSIKTFTARAAKSGAVVLHVSADLPFAAKRFCTAESLDATTVSTFRSTFAADYGLELASGPLAGLCSRCVLVLDEKNVVRHAEQVPDIGKEPDYDAALKALAAK
jgi:thiol peroxidase